MNHFSNIATEIGNKGETILFPLMKANFFFMRITDQRTLSAPISSSLSMLYWRGGILTIVFGISEDFSCLERAKKILVSVVIWTCHFMQHGRASTGL